MELSPRRRQFSPRRRMDLACFPAADDRQHLTCGGGIYCRTRRQAGLSGVAEVMLVFGGGTGGKPHALTLRRHAPETELLPAKATHARPPKQPLGGNNPAVGKETRNWRARLTQATWSPSYPWRQGVVPNCTPVASPYMPEGNMCWDAFSALCTSLNDARHGHKHMEGILNLRKL